MSDRPSLITFAPMIDSELCRFLLGHYGIAYTEAPHLFGWASVLSTIDGWTPRIPLLYGGGYNVAGPRALVDLVDSRVDPAHRLLPADPELRQAVDRDWDRFNGELGTAVAVIAYYRLLPARVLMLEPFGRGVPAAERGWLPAVYPLLAGLFRLGLGLSAASAQRQLDLMRVILDETDRRLADGRAHLVGESVTLADLALATACAPLLLPPGFGSPMPPAEQWPPALAAVAAELRQHPTAGHVDRIYRRYRLP